MASAVSQVVFVSDEYSVGARDDDDDDDKPIAEHTYSIGLVFLVFLVSRSSEGHANLREKGARIWLSGSRREHHLFNIAASESSRFSFGYVHVSRRRKEEETRRGCEKTGKKEEERMRTTRENDRVNRLTFYDMHAFPSFLRLSFPDSRLMG